ncbi:TPM domain-containing protein [Vagococcus jeotgali]|uniref:TPM domain-containing protein n=1 Tax=Vagococcus jeotgali TaxID=3109030 RepID=UPI002DDA059B|nr:TPM domain-containing protein [Vagococcus sp. B2T-5]
MKKIYSHCLILAVSLLILLGFSGQVLAQSSRIFDEANLFDSSEKQHLQQEIDTFIKDTNMDFVLVTTEDTKGEDWEAYADNFYDEGPFGTNDTKDGMLFLIDMEHRKFHISTTGHMIPILNDNRIQTIIDHITPDMVEGDYEKAVSNVIHESFNYVKKGPVNGYTYDPETGKSIKVKYLSPTKWTIAVIFGLGCGGAMYLMISRKYLLKKSEYHYPYQQMSSLDLTESNTTKVYDVVTQRHVPKPSSNNGGGGSSTHMGGSGTSHGGGSGSF